MKTDIRQFSDDELSLIVFNSESLYRQRRRLDFINMISKWFIYTNAQLKVLKNDLNNKAA